MPILDGFDFTLLSSPDFKEDSVREEIVLPILHALGYSVGGLNQIIRSRTLQHPFVNIGSTKKNITLIPDYLLTVRNKPAWILDAKAPHEEITTGENVEQAYSYAIHPDVRVRVYALCNGREFAAFAVDDAKPLIYVHVSEIQHHLQHLYDLLSPPAFSAQKPTVREGNAEWSLSRDYANIKPLAEIRDLERQSAKRHFGVHPYFTKQVWNVVQEYIKNFTRPGDTVLDPYGGSGVTLIEALVLKRNAIQVDINPLGVCLSNTSARAKRT